MNNKEIIKAIQKEQQAKGMTDYAASKAANISQSHFNTVMMFQCSPTLDTLQRICNAVGLQLSLTPKVHP